MNGSDEAELWFARRRDPARRQAHEPEFKRWRDGHPDHGQAYAATEALWQQLEALNGSARLQALADTEAQPPSLAPGGRRARGEGFRLPKLILLAASVALAVFCFLFVQIRSSAQTYITTVGEQRAETLTDGTQFILNTDTELDVRYTRKRREITLRSGEAVFDVAPDSEKPFIATAGGGSVTVLGTRFQLRRDSNKVIVTLMEGSVRVARIGQRSAQMLVPGQQAIYSDAGKGITTRNVDTSINDSWIRGRLEFRSTPLSEAIEEANRYSTVKLKLGSAALATMPISGSFRTGDISGMAAGLLAAYPLRLRYAKDEILVLPAQ